VGLFSFRWELLELVLALDVCLVLAWWNLRKDREERLQRRRSAFGPYYRDYFLRHRPEVQEAEQLEIHRAEQAALRARIDELEDQLARTQDTVGSGLSTPSQGSDEQEAPEVVAVVEIGQRPRAEDERPESKATEKRPTQLPARLPFTPAQRSEIEELTIRRKAITVLLAALEDAAAQGALTQEGYRAKRSTYRRELRRIEKSLKTPP
jgi:hypothetical protein